VIKKAKQSLAKKVPPGVKNNIKKATKYLKDAAAKHSTAAKVVAAASVAAVAGVSITGIVDMVDDASADGYHYVSYPRRAYVSEMPSFAETFLDASTRNELYTWGTLTQASEDMTKNFTTCREVVCEDEEMDMDNREAPIIADGIAMGEDFKLSTSYSDRVVASFTGAKAKTGMLVRGEIDDQDSFEDTILLTFSGGHGVDYSYTQNEKVSDDMYSIGVSMTAEMKNKYEMKLEGLLGVIAQVAMATAGLDDRAKNAFEKEISFDRVFAWNKHAGISALYSLGDPDVGDKFVVQVGSDKRFGTPLFITKGGRSKCSGEPFTVMRESGIGLTLSSVSHAGLDPGEKAFLSLKVTNESPYREGISLVLRISDGLAESVSTVLDAAYSALGADSSGPDVYEAVLAASEDVYAKYHAVIAEMIDAARYAAENGGTAAVVAAAVAYASKSAPTVGIELEHFEFTINNVQFSPVSDVIPLNFIHGDMLHVQRIVHESSFTLGIQALNPAMRVLEYAKVSVTSACEYAMKADANLQRDALGSAVPLRLISWLQRCPEVRFDRKTIKGAPYTLTSGHNELQLSVINPNNHILWPGGAVAEDDPRANVNLVKVRVQYRSTSSGEWISAHSSNAPPQDEMRQNLLCETSRGDGCAFDWKLDNLMDNLMTGSRDGTYEVRAKTFCASGDVLAHEDVHEYVSDETFTFSVDTASPLVQQRAHDSTARTVSVSFTEEIECSKARVTILQKFDGACKQTNAPIDEWTIRKRYNSRCLSGGRGQWIMEYPDFITGTFEIHLSGIQDLSGNDAPPYSFVFNAGFDGCDAVLCPENHRVSARACVPCDVGYARRAGDDIRKDDTQCVTCAAGYFYDAKKKVCQTCVNPRTSEGGAVDQKCDRCIENHFISSKSNDGTAECSPCAPGTYSRGGDAHACEPIFCAGRHERVSNHECVPCDAGSLRARVFPENAPGDDASKSDTKCDACTTDHYMDSQKCTPCPPGSSKKSGAGGIENCLPLICPVDHYVNNHKCVACPDGYVRRERDNATMRDTHCDRCAAKTHRVNERHECVPCDLGYQSVPSNASRWDSGPTTCELCAPDFRVSLIRENFERFGCTACPKGYSSRGGANATAGKESACTWCAENHHVVEDGDEYKCSECSKGERPDPTQTHRLIPENSKTTSTRCVPKVCAFNEHVSNLECVGCPTGYVRVLNGTRGDDVTVLDTRCELCAENFTVVGDNVTGFACAPCQGHGIMPAGTNVTAATAAVPCVHQRCHANERVVNHVCVSCAVGYRNAGGDDPAGGDTRCTTCAQGFKSDGHGACVKCPAGTTRAAGDDRFGRPTHCEATDANVAPNLGHATSPRAWAMTRRGATFVVSAAVVALLAIFSRRVVQRKFRERHSTARERHAVLADGKTSYGAMNSAA